MIRPLALQIPRSFCPERRALERVATGKGSRHPTDHPTDRETQALQEGIAHAVARFDIVQIAVFVLDDLQWFVEHLAHIAESFAEKVADVGEQPPPPLCLTCWAACALALWLTECATALPFKTTLPPLAATATALAGSLPNSGVAARVVVRSLARPGVWDATGGGSEA